MPGTADLLESLGPRERPTKVSLLNVRDNKLPFKYLCFYPQVNALFSLDQRVVFLFCFCTGHKLVKVLSHSKLTWGIPLNKASRLSP